MQENISMMIRPWIIVNVNYYEDISYLFWWFFLVQPEKISVRKVKTSFTYESSAYFVYDRKTDLYLPCTTSLLLDIEFPKFFTVFLWSCFPSLFNVIENAPIVDWCWFVKIQSRHLFTSMPFMSFIVSFSAILFFSVLLIQALFSSTLNKTKFWK